MSYKFSIKDTIIRNLGLLIKFTFQVILFMIGLNVITTNNDQTFKLFLTLIWCFLYFAHIKFNPTIIYKNKKGDRTEEY